MKDKVWTVVLDLWGFSKTIEMPEVYPYIVIPVARRDIPDLRFGVKNCDDKTMVAHYACEEGVKE